MKKTNLENLGFTQNYKNEATLYPDLYVGRVLSQSRNIYRVGCENGELLAEISGKMRYAAQSATDFPAVGDFVMLDRTSDANGNAIIQHILTRKSIFVRKAAGTSNEEQVVASNIDTIFICMSLNNDFNLRRLERYLAISWDSGATPVVVLTKADLCDSIDEKLQEAELVCLGVDILVTSAMHEDGYADVLRYVKPEKTIAFIGSSGVGKSSLINRLVGEEKYDVNGLRNDDKGRHTTTRRELIQLSMGGLVIDTPGMRELALESADFEKTFSDIDELSSHCKFRDCTHNDEPNCAVQQAILDGILSADRLESYRKLKKEAKYEGMNSKQIEHEKLSVMLKDIGGVKNFKKFIKTHKKR